MAIGIEGHDFVEVRSEFLGSRNWVVLTDECDATIHIWVRVRRRRPAIEALVARIRGRSDCDDPPRRRRK